VSQSEGWAVLLLAALVIVPVLLGARGVPAPRPRRIAFLAALPLVPAMLLGAGPASVLLSLPWLLVTATVALAALGDGLRSLPGILRPDRVPELGLLVARGFLAVGAFFIAADRARLALGFDPQIVLLTAVHFHFAGFGLLTIASLLASRTRLLRLAVIGLMVGIPFTALGFVTGVPAINALGACLTAASGFAVGVILALGWGRDRHTVDRRLPLAAAGVALMISMPLAVAWSVSLALGSSFLDVDRMMAVHGSLNALAVLIAAVFLPGVTALAAREAPRPPELHLQEAHGQ
jgi:hypothetical protein